MIKTLLCFIDKDKKELQVEKKFLKSSGAKIQNLQGENSKTQTN